MYSSLPPAGKTLLSNYETACLCDSYNRSQVSKLITIYNKANPTQKIHPYMVISKRYPTFIKYLCSKYNVPEDQLFESKFLKLFFNLNILPSLQTSTAYNGTIYSRYCAMASYSGISNNLFEEAYTGKNVLFKSIVDGSLFDFNGSRFINQANPTFTISSHNQDVFALFQEI